jgi:hypothetical protein
MVIWNPWQRELLAFSAGPQQRLPCLHFDSTFFSFQSWTVVNTSVPRPESDFEKILQENSIYNTIFANFFSKSSFSC